MLETTPQLPTSLPVKVQQETTFNQFRRYARTRGACVRACVRASCVRACMRVCVRAYVVCACGPLPVQA
eukprot:3494475-Amphidinium_carterae.1